MANAIYPAYKEALLGAAADSSLTASGTSGVYVALIDTALYTYNATHSTRTDIATAIVGVAVELTAKTITTGVFDCADATFSTVTGNSVEALVIYRRNPANEALSRLVAFIDTGVTGLPVNPNGGDIIVTWSASGVFAL